MTFDILTGTKKFITIRNAKAYITTFKFVTYIKIIIQRNRRIYRGENMIAINSKQQGYS
jgi:hypothetical protein